jgi:hypothetical protein
MVQKKGELIVLDEELKYLTGQFSRNRASRLHSDQVKVLFYEMVNPVMNYSEDYWDAYSDPEFPGKSLAELNSEFEANHGKRVRSLPKQYSSYQDMYADQQIFDLFMSEF